MALEAFFDCFCEITCLILFEHRACTAQQPRSMASIGSKMAIKFEGSQLTLSFQGLHRRVIPPVLPFSSFNQKPYYVTSLVQ